MVEITDAKRRIIERLKRHDSVTANQLATEFGLTDTAIRQHLEALENSGLVVRGLGVASGRGRPPVQWSLLPLAAELFPDRHADLTVELIASIRDSLGEDALAQVIRTRALRQASTYGALIDPGDDMVANVRRLAEIRTVEGYLAETAVDGDAVVLTEHHCPIRGAAEACASLCAAELQLFRETLGPRVRVEREQHVLAGAHRCSYRIRAA